MRNRQLSLKSDYQLQIEQAKTKREQLEANHVELSKRRQELNEVNQADEATRISDELAKNEKAISFLKDLQDHAEAQIAEWKANEPKAAEIRKRLAEELWPKSSKPFGKIRDALSAISSAIAEADQQNGTVQQSLSEIERLTGEPIVGVPVISNFIPLELRRVAAIQLPKLPEILELKLHSQEMKESQERLDAAFDAKMAKQKALILPYLRAQNMQWPTCGRKGCGKELVLLAASVYDGSQRKPAFGDGPELQSKAFRLQFACEVGPHNGSAGFVRIEAGAFHVLPLRDLEIER